MTFDYSRIAGRAVDLLAKFGQAITFGSVTTGVYDPATGTVTNVTTNYTGKGAAFDYEQKDIDGTNIRQGDRRVYIAANLGVVPKSGDTVTLADGAVLNVVASRPLSPAGTVVLHDVQCRGVA